MEKKIRKEIKYSNEEWNKVIELSAVYYENVIFKFFRMTVYF